MFLKHHGDLLFQITTGYEISEVSAATKKAAVRRCLDFLSPVRLLNFQQDLFPTKLLKTNPLHPCSRCFLTRNLKKSSDRCSTMFEWSFLVCRPLHQ